MFISLRICVTIEFMPYRKEVSIVFEYSDEERAEIQSRINDERYKNKPMDMSMAYQLYDLLRITLECVGEINDRLNAIEDDLNK